MGYLYDTYDAALSHILFANTPSINPHFLHPLVSGPLHISGQ